MEHRPEMALQQAVDGWVEQKRKYTKTGEAASYIPELQEADSNALGIVIIGSDGTKITSGDTNTPFSIQSISKVFSFIVACMQHGVSRVLKRVDVEPTGEPFNSLAHLEVKKAEKPLNPMVNTGAITVTSMLEGDTPEEKLEGLFGLYESIIGRPPKIIRNVYESEKETAHRNRAIGYMLLEMGVLASDLDVTLDAYFKQCAMEVYPEDLAKLGLVLANDGVDHLAGKEVIPKEIARLAKVLMVTCGMYDASGKFAAEVGVPAKSGVAGGIMAAVPPQVKKEHVPFTDGCGIGLYGPALDEQGNSVAGIQLLRHLSERWDWSIF
mgnify:CR=1 FL=1